MSDYRLNPENYVSTDKDLRDGQWVIARIANGEVEARGEAAGVTGVQLAERSAALEHEVIEHVVSMQ